MTKPPSHAQIIPAWLPSGGRDCEFHFGKRHGWLQVRRGALPGALIFRPESSLIYFNVEHVREVILNRVQIENPPPQLVVLDLSAAPFVDLQSVHTLASMADELTAAGIRFQAVEARSAVRVRLRDEGGRLETWRCRPVHRRRRRRRQLQGMKAKPSPQRTSPWRLSKACGLTRFEGASRATDPYRWIHQPAL